MPAATVRIPGCPLEAGPFLTDQLIAYIGNKRKLLDLLAEAIGRTGLRQGVFFDAFAGSGVVSRLAKSSGFRVVANDWEPYTRFINETYVVQNRMPEFRETGGAQALFDHLNTLPGQAGYISTHHCPADDDNPDYDRERMFYTQQNGQRLDAMREEVERMRDAGRISDAEHAVLVAALVFGASYCSNTSGVFKGFHRGWGGATRTAWYRIRAPLRLRLPVLFDNGLRNEAVQMDAKVAAAQIPCDIAYLDPPYNQHQYGANYHLLNTIALWDKPEIPARFTPEARGIKAAIRTDWRTERNSAFCRRSLAQAELARVMEALKAKWVLVSYSTDGLIPLENLVDTLALFGRLSWVYRPYKRYRVSSQRPSPRPHTLEFVLVVETGAPADMSTRDEILRTCETASSRQPTLFEEASFI